MAVRQRRYGIFEDSWQKTVNVQRQAGCLMAERQKRKQAHTGTS